MDAELQKDIERLKWHLTACIRFIARNQITAGDTVDDADLYRRTIARLESLAVDDGEITEPTIPPEFQVPGENFWKAIAECTQTRLAAETARAEKAEAELAVAESERAMYRRLHEADLIELAAQSQAVEQPTDQQLIAAKFDQLKELCLRKNADYGSTFARPPCLAPGVKASDAVLVRMSDKIGRLQSLLSGKSAEIEESIEDTVSDLSVYGILYLIAREKEKA